MADELTGKTITAVAAVNQAYVMPLTVMVRSLLENLGPDYSVKLYVLEDGTTAASRTRAETSWRPYPLRTEWITPDKSRIEGKLQDRGYAGVPATYFRLLIEDLLPPSVNKAIYLDADLVVQGDLSELWNIDMNGHLALAVPDAYSGLFHFGRLSRIQFREGVRFDYRSAYFNAGVLVMDVEAWRRERVGARSLSFAEKYKDRLTFHDQDALNCALQGRWGSISPAWNFHELPGCLFHWSRRSYSKQDLRGAFAHPRIVHFIGAKPWTRRCTNVATKLFLDYLQRTEWANDALPAASPLADAVWDAFVMPHGRADWLWWRGVVHEWSGRRIRSLLWVLVSHPWMLISYPLWQLYAWARFVRVRILAADGRL